MEEQELLRQPGRQIAMMCVTIELPDELPKVRVWEGPSIGRIKKAAREKYGPKATLQFGAALWKNFYGAH